MLASAFALSLVVASTRAEPAPFWWGAGGSAFQMEGEPADSDWRRWTRQPGRIADGTDAERAARFWAQPEKELDLARELGATMYRLSIAWERVEPEPGRWDDAALDRYERILSAMRRRGLEPLVTLHHFALPGWLADKGGLTAEEFPERYAAYASRVVRRLSRGPGRVRWWMTFNEPMVLVTGGYLLGEWPPGLRSPLEAKRAAEGLVRAHTRAVAALRADTELPRDLKLSVAYHWRPVDAAGWGPLDPFVAWAGDRLLNRWFLEAIRAGETLDYLGVNYYGRTVVRRADRWPFVALDEGLGVRSDLGWVVHPEGLGRALRDASAAYGLPLLVAENGVADASDRLRPDFLRAHLAEVRRAREAGIPVIGYLHWALTDNFEWAKGLAPRFGLVALDHETGRRSPRPSFRVYRDLIREGLPPTRQDAPNLLHSPSTGR
ncbi:MAG: family 1 glycosylhydrolase [Elusimicrobiota bacterium]|nr:family 1 glycosylhydrolase [Elusimicrobiota bacterium]